MFRVLLIVWKLDRGLHSQVIEFTSEDAANKAVERIEATGQTYTGKEVIRLW